MLSWITKIVLELMTYEAMFATLLRHGASAMVVLWGCFLPFRFSLPFSFLCAEKKKVLVSGEEAREVLVFGSSVWWLVLTAEQSCGDPDRYSNPSGPIVWSCLSWSCRCPNPTDGNWVVELSGVCWCSNPTHKSASYSCMVYRPESFGILCFPSCAVDRH
jgi:hypothetical protein